MLWLILLIIPLSLVADESVDDYIASHFADHQTEYAQLFHSIFHPSNTPIDLEFLKEFEKNLEASLQNLMGRGLFLLSGYNSHPSIIGVFGNGEFSDKVRITFINGMLSFPEHQASNLEMLTATHLGANIHYISRPTAGWTWDMVGCILSRMGVASEQAGLLAKCWKELIAEMGGASAGGVIIHYAHSIGGSETVIAKQYLAPEEQKMIRVYTLGSPSLIPPGGFQKVINYVSCRDGVCLLDPVGFVQGLSDPNRNIIYVDTFLGTPLVDHPLSTPSYQAVIQELGQQFVEEFLLEKN